MTAQEALDRFRDVLLRDFHHGHELGIVLSAHGQVSQELQAPVTGDND